VRPRKTTANRFEASIEFALPLPEDEVWRYTKLLTAPLFTLFEFAKFGDDIFQDIVSKFQQGNLT
jgi:hypothetical protein